MDGLGLVFECASAFIVVGLADVNQFDFHVVRRVFGKAGFFLFGSRRVDLSLADGAYVRIQCFTQDD